MYFLYFVLNFLHCSTGQKLMLSGHCILSILLFPFIFIVYFVYDFIINKINNNYKQSKFFQINKPTLTSLQTKGQLTARKLFTYNNIHNQQLQAYMCKRTKTIIGIK